MQERTPADGRIRLFLSLFPRFLASRALLALPLFLPLGFLPFWPRAALRAVLCLAAAVLVCGPERESRALLLAAAASSAQPLKKTYAAMVRSAAVRVLRVLPLIVLFLIPALLLVYSVFDTTQNFKAMRILKTIGDPVKDIFFRSSGRASYDFGVGALLAAAAVFLAAAAVRWHRDVPLDYQRDLKAFHRQRSAAWRRTSVVNLLLGLPAYLLWLAALAVSYRSFSSGRYRGLMDALMTSNKPVSAMLHSRVLLVYLVLILLLVYMPCWCLRKWKLTRVCAEEKTDAA